MSSMARTPTKHALHPVRAELPREGERRHNLGRVHGANSVRFATERLEE